MASNTKTFSVSIDADRETVTITDSITYVDPVRADGAVHFSVSKVDAEGVETVLTVTSDDDNPDTDSAWSFPYENGDGYYKARYAWIATYDGATEYDQYDCVDVDGSVYQSKSDSNTGNSVSSTVYWTPISDGASIADLKGEDDEAGNCDTTIYERVFTSNAQYAYGNLIAENSMYTESDDAGVMEDYDLFSLWLNGAIVCDERTLPLNGEVICRRISSRFID